MIEGNEDAENEDGEEGGKEERKKGGRRELEMRLTAYSALHGFAVTTAISGVKREDDNNDEDMDEDMDEDKDEDEDEDEDEEEVVENDEKEYKREGQGGR
ncbi:hypothetical protein HZH66_008068 [Vespula vulgaris]|uniref:Uncharacterized protein n=1 Tax=Vespula vulgaris TaxID=7454 RepID=A0A834N4Q0_VESVU|nr:hypothetical protein HZH66_008068 [Vespula vulgaris]